MFDEPGADSVAASAFALFVASRESVGVTQLVAAGLVSVLGAFLYLPALRGEKSRALAAGDPEVAPSQG